MTDQPRVQAQPKGRLAYFLLSSPDPNGHWRPCIAEENEPGYWQTDYDYGTDHEAAQRAVDALNSRRGLSPEDAARVVISSIAAGPIKAD